MSSSRSLTSHKSRSEKKLLDVIDNDNLNEFFSQPSAHELSLASELRIAEIIDDLQRRTTEELQSWTLNSSEASESVSKCRATNDSQTSQYVGLPSNARFHSGDVVGSPVSYLPSSALTSPNLKLGSTARRAKKSFQSLQQRRSRAFSTSTTGSQPQTPKSPLTLSHKPSFQSFLKRVAKTPSQPLPEVSIRDYALATPLTPPPAKEPEQAPAKAQAVLGLRKSTLFVPRVVVGDCTVDEEQNIPPLPMTSSSSQTPVISSTAMPSKAAAILGIEEFGPPPRSDTAPLEKKQTRKPRPRSLSDSQKAINIKPLTHINHAKSTKRKPLPRDSPLLIPLARHPALTETQKSNIEGLEILVADRKKSIDLSKVSVGTMQKVSVSTSLRKSSEDENLDALDMVLPLPPTPVAAEQKT